MSVGAFCYIYIYIYIVMYLLHLARSKAQRFRLPPCHGEIRNYSLWLGGTIVPPLHGLQKENRQLL